RVDELEQAKFEMQALLVPVIQIVERVQDDLQISREFFFREQQCRSRGAGALVTGDLQQLRLFAVELGHQCIAQVAYELARQRKRAVPGIEQRIELLHQGRSL